jgi:hypothetical protein
MSNLSKQKDVMKLASRDAPAKLELRGTAGTVLIHKLVPVLIREHSRQLTRSSYHTNRQRLLATKKLPPPKKWLNNQSLGMCNSTVCYKTINQRLTAGLLRNLKVHP